MKAAMRRVAISYIDTEVPCSEPAPSQRATTAIASDPHSAGFFSFGAYRIYAATAAAFPEDDVRIFAGTAGRPEELAAAIESFDPDVFGASCYVWSFGTFVEVARLLKARRPHCTVVFGGPCAHPAMFALPPFIGALQYVDALITGEGEEVFRDVVALSDRSPSGLAGVPGLTVRTSSGLRQAHPRSRDSSLEDLASPFQMRLAPVGVAGHLETFRGCPRSCAFCEWGGASGRTSRVVSREWLVRELETFRETGAQSAFLVDPGFNLSSRAFKNLAAAERQVRFFREHPVSFEVYPDHIHDEHLEFLSECLVGHVGAGLQSTNKETLQRIHRHFDEQKFSQGVRRLSQLTESTTVEIIYGLPMDSPESFKRTLDVAMGFGGNVNVLAFHCLVLPEGLMARAPEGSNIKFDPYTLRVISCSGWSERDLERTREELADLIAVVGGRHGDLWSQIGLLEHLHEPVHPTAPLPLEAVETVLQHSTDEVPRLPLDSALQTEIAECIESATGGAWRVTQGSREPGVIAVRLNVSEHDVWIEMRSPNRDSRSYRVLGGVAFSYSCSPGESSLTGGGLLLLDRAVAALGGRLHLRLRAALDA